MLILFSVLLFMVGAGFFLGAPALWAYARSLQWGERRIIICPETGNWAEVSADGAHAAQTELGGRAELRLNACSRWPEREDCDQACAPQIAMVGDDRRSSGLAPFGLEPRFLRVNSPARMSPLLYARLAATAAEAATHINN
ncbi:MAG: hypothetical protein ACR2IF_04140 [Terriglobales bacterium]